MSTPGQEVDTRKGPHRAHADQCLSLTMRIVYGRLTAPSWRPWWAPPPRLIESINQRLERRGDFG